MCGERSGFQGDCQGSCRSITAADVFSLGIQSTSAYKLENIRRETKSEIEMGKPEFKYP